MDARQLAFLDAVDDERTARKSDSKAVVKRIGALGTGLTAATAFLALTAAPASAAQTTEADAGASPAAALAYSCYEPNRQTSDHTKGCYDGAWVYFHYVGSNPCGPGGQRSILYFERTIHNPCAGDIEQLVATSCA
jgi:hypothetical protein